MDNLSKDQRKINMQNIRSFNTKPERIIMKELLKLKIYFAKNVKTIMGKPDIVFRKKKIIVFIDSDFWHCNINKFVMPKTNKKYWKEKITKNIERDILVNKTLKKQGWKVLRFWESNIYKNPKVIIDKIIRTLN
jgi:DNA mismatch endonuclease Vsr